MVKRCAWGTCKSDSRYPERLKTEDGKIIKFHSFPSAKKFKERREKWIRACCRGDAFKCKKDSYICSLHFLGQQGPTKENPIPFPANANKEKVLYFKYSERDLKFDCSKIEIYLFKTVLILYTDCETEPKEKIANQAKSNNQTNPQIRRKFSCRCVVDAT